MNQDNIHDALKLLDDELINEVNKLRDIRKKRKSVWIRWGTMAACVCILLVSVYVIGNGDYLALQGTYDNKEVWDYICFNITDSRGYYVALNEGAEVWWEEYGTEAMSILTTVQITEGANVEYLD